MTSDDDNEREKGITLGLILFRWEMRIAQDESTGAYENHERTPHAQLSNRTPEGRKRFRQWVDGVEKRLDGVPAVPESSRVATDAEIAEVIFDGQLTTKEIAERFRVSERTVRYWRTGEVRPGIQKELALLGEFAVPLTDWQQARLELRAVELLSDMADHEDPRVMLKACDLIFKEDHRRRRREQRR